MKESLLKEAFEARIKLENISTTISNFENSLRRLSGSVIKQFMTSKGEKKIAPINPSVYDYLIKKLDNNPNEKDKIIESALYVDQINKIVNDLRVHKKLKQLVESNKLLNMKYIEISPEYYYLYYIFSNRIKEEKYKKGVEYCIISENFANKQALDCSILDHMLSNKEMFDYYDLSDIIINKASIEIIFKNLNFENYSYFTKRFIRFVEDSTNIGLEKYIEELQFYYVQLILEESVDFFNERLEQYFSDADQEYFDTYEKWSGELDDNWMINKVVDLMNDDDYVLEEHLDELHSNKYLKLSYDIDEIIELVEVEDGLYYYKEQRLEEEKADYLADQWKDMYRGGMNEDSLIDDIFAQKTE